LDGGEVVGFLWVTFAEIEGYELTVAEVMDIELIPAYQRQGHGSMILAHAETLAIERGAQVLRSETGVENVASQALHRKAGFEVHRLRYEKLLDV
jgi:ribosomal protein S18 acetylase RimI-like enzyme